ncbi:hypothetical protein M9458_043136, partial [Cirrhinus mrigala]
MVYQHLVRPSAIMSQRQTSTSEDDSDSPLPHLAAAAWPELPRITQDASAYPRLLWREPRPTPQHPPIDREMDYSLKLALTKSDIQPSRKLNKAELYELYKNLHPTNRSPEPSPASKVTKRKSKPPVMPTPPSSSRAGPHVTPATAQPSTAAPPPATPGPAAQASDWSLLPSVSFSLEPTAQASAWPHLLPDSAPLPARSNLELAAQASACPAACTRQLGAHNSSQRLAALVVKTAPPPAPVSSGLTDQANARPHWLPFTVPPPTPFSSGFAAQASTWLHWPPCTAPPPTPVSSGLAAHASVWPLALPNSAPPPASFSSLLQTKPQYSLFTSSPMPIAPNAIASEPPQVAHNIRAQILAGADVDLSSLLSLLSTNGSNHQIDCGDFSVTPKDSNRHSSRLLSFPEFSIAFSRFTKIICSAFPHRRRSSMII